VVAVDYPANRPIGIHQNGNQDAADRDVRPESFILVGGKWGQREDGPVTAHFSISPWRTTVKLGNFSTQLAHRTEVAGSEKLLLTSPSHGLFEKLR
jgi:hypothetical protein